MAETANISKIAEIISADIFPEFLWKKIGPENSNWPCEHQESHSVQTHPTDVVFWYDDPYEDRAIYVQCDLKSYASDSIGKSQLEKAILSLAMQVRCAEVSETWHSRYVHSHKNFDICGLLFVYNHDGGYDRNFEDVLAKTRLEDIDLPENGRIFVLGPSEIFWLNNISQEIARMRGKQSQNNLPEQSKCSYFYPQQARRAQIRGEQQCAATMEMLTGPWIILHHKQNQHVGEGFLIFYRPGGETVEEFLYLIDYMRRNSMLDEKYTVRIKALNSAGVPSNNFQKAKQRFVEGLNSTVEGSGSLTDIVNNIQFIPLNNITPVFSELQIGMEYER